MGLSASKSLRGSPSPIPTKHPKPHGRFPTIHSNLPHYIRTQTQIPRRHLNSREPQSIPIFTKNAPTPFHYIFPRIRQPLRLLSQPRHAPQSAPPPEGRRRHPSVRKRRGPAPSLLPSSCRASPAPTWFPSAPLLTDVRVMPPANEWRPFGAMPI